MGIDKTTLEAILISQKYLLNKKNMLTLARQQIHMQPNIMYEIVKKYNYNVPLQQYNSNCENFFNSIGFENIDSIDNSAYENATIIQNLNCSFESNTKYDYIFDGGTIEHIFNIPQVCENIINMLNINGIYCCVTVNNNFSGHGIYQFSPEFFLTTFSEKYGMKILELYIAETNTEINKWINVNSYNGWRNNSTFNTTHPVYIIGIMQKISDDRQSLILNPPNQFSYESIDWRK